MIRALAGLFFVAAVQAMGAAIDPDTILRVKKLGPALCPENASGPWFHVDQLHSRASVERMKGSALRPRAKNGRCKEQYSDPESKRSCSRKAGRDLPFHPRAGICDPLIEKHEKSRLSPRSGSREKSLLNASAIRARFLSVGTTRPVSNWERKLADRPTCCPSSTSPIDRLNRRRRIFSPIFFASMEASAVASSTPSIPRDWCRPSLSIVFRRPQMDLLSVAMASLSWRPGLNL